MATHDYVIANASGAAVRADLNNALAAIVTNNSNATAPATTYAYQWWADTTANQLKLRNSANDGWIVIQELDGTMLMENGSAASPGLAFASDTDTGLFRPAANQLGIATSGVERVEFGTTEVVFNDSGADVDLRVEGDAEANLLKIDAGNDRIGIAESAPGTLVEIGSTAPYVTLKNSTEEDTDGGRESRLIFEGEQSGGEISTLAQVEVSHDGTADDEKGKLVISTNDGSDGASPTAALTISSDQTVAVADNLTVNGNQYPTAGALSNRNLIINGAMQVAQRGTSFATNNAGNFAVDRFACNASANTTITFSQETDAPVGFANSLKATITSANSSRQAGDTNYVLHAIEGNNFAHLNFGSANAKTFTLSFYVKSSITGTYGVGFASNGSGRVRHTTYTINAANTWERKTVTVPGDTSGTWLTNNGIGLIPLWDLGMGTDFESNTIDTWDANADYRRSSDVNLSLTASATWQITGVQLELGTKATPFEHRNYGDELARCQRYYYRITRDSGADIRVGVGQAIGTGVADILVEYPVVMRARPTALEQSGTASDYLLTNSGGSFVTGNAVPSHQVASLKGATLRQTVASGLTAGNCAFLTLQNTGNGHLGWSAEL